jgi:cyclopropane fatty-acyl-phospholipid synthase-like methyltransferase
MIGADGWQKFNIWEHSETVRNLYARRCRDVADEMTCHAQAAALLAPHVAPGDTLLDAGCGSGYFYHSLRKRGIGVEYFGIDATKCLIELGQRYLPAFGLPAANLQTLRIEDMRAEVDHVLCINVLSNIDNYHRPLERLLLAARKTVILRESCSEVSSYIYVKDRFLDEGVDLNVHVNTYAVSGFVKFIESYGFDVETARDERTDDAVEMVIGYPHYWKFFVCVRQGQPP